MHAPPIDGLSEWRPLARGGTAVVWQARQLSLDRLVAVKVYSCEWDEGHRRRFLREAAAAGRVSTHPGIVTTYDAGILADNRPYLMMELCPGGSLSGWLKPENRPDPEQVRALGARIADALAGVHACGVLHRDLKPANILIDRYGNPRLADFGLAVLTDARSGSADELGVTPAYAPPEALSGRPATEAGDVFSLAATLYALLTGGPPRAVRGTPATIEQLVEVAHRPVDPPAGVDRHLAEVLMTALSDEPGSRPSAARLRDQLTRLPVPRPARRRAAALVMAAAAFAMIAPGAALLVGDSPSREVSAATTLPASSATTGAPDAPGGDDSPAPPSAAGVARAEKALTQCRRQIRAGDRVITSADRAMTHLTQFVQAKAHAGSGSATAQDRKVLTRSRLAAPDDVKRYRRAVRAYAGYGHPCDPVLDAPTELATRLADCADQQRAQLPVLAAAADLEADWRSHQADLRRLQTGHGQDADRVWIRIWVAVTPQVEAWDEASARYRADDC